MTDIERLPLYDVYVCSGAYDGLNANIEALKPGQTLCLINMLDPLQVAAFLEVFRGSFNHINGDYRGNTPRIYAALYKDLLAPGGNAYNIDGINCITLPEEELLNALEVFAPILPDTLKARRIWTSQVLELAKDNRLSPSDLWHSPDLTPLYYSSVINGQKQFREDQKRRSPMWWPREGGITLEEYWKTLPVKLIISSLRLAVGYPYCDETMEAIRPYMARFSAFLDEVIGVQQGTTLDTMAYIDAMGSCKTDEELVRLRQRIITDLYADYGGLMPHITSYVDDRYETCPVKFGLVLTRLPL